MGPHVLPADLPELRRARGHRLRLRRRGIGPPARAAELARAQRVQLLPPQRRGRAARVVVPPLRVPRWFVAERDTRTNEVLLDRAARRRARTPRQPPGDDRLAPQPGERIDRGRRSTSPSTASRCAAFAGDTIASALYAAGRRTFSRSFKYHRRRGELGGAGSARTRSWPSTGARACARAPSRARRHAVEHMNAQPGARLRRHARDRPLRRPVHAARLLLQDVHPAAAAVAGVREGAPPRRRPRAAAQAPGRARVAHRVPPPPLPTCS